LITRLILTALGLFIERWKTILALHASQRAGRRLGDDHVSIRRLAQPASERLRGERCSLAWSPRTVMRNESLKWRMPKRAAEFGFVLPENPQIMMPRVLDRRDATA